MGREKNNENQELQFTKWIGAHRTLPAWKALGFPAREAYFHLQIRCFAETAQKQKRVKNNNGNVFRSPRKLAEDMGCNVKTAMSALADLQAKGWIECTSRGCLGSDGRGETAKFRLTMLPSGQGSHRVPATQDPKHWSEGCAFPVLVYESYLPKRKKGDATRLRKQNPAPVCGADQHQFVVQERKITPDSAPVFGAKNAQNRPEPAPVCGANLITISPEILRANYSEERGLCGLALKEPV